MTPLEIQRAKRAYYRNLCARIRAENEHVLMHYGVKGMKWGVRRTPEQLGHRKSAKKVANSSKSGRLSHEILTEALRTGEVTTKLNVGHQKKHLPDRVDKGRSYILGDLATAQRLVNELSGTGVLIADRNGWAHKERVWATDKVGVFVSEDSTEVRTNKLIIHYGKKGSHIMAGQVD